MTDALGVKIDIALPTIARWKAAGIPLDLTEIVMAGLNDTERQNLGQELSGIGNDPLKMMTESTATAFFGKMMSLAQGDATLNQLNLTPEQTKKMFTQVRSLNWKSAVSVTNGTATDTITDGFRNTQMEIATQAGQISTGAPATVMANGILSVLGSSPDGNLMGSRRALDKLIKGGDTEAEVAGLGTRAAVSKLVIGLGTHPNNLKFGDWELRYDNKQGKYVEHYNGPSKAVPKVNAVSSGRRELMPVKSGPSPKPAELSKVGTALNSGLDFLVNTGSWSESTPKGTALELRNFYAQGRPTKSMRAEAESQSKTPQADALKAADAFLTDLHKRNFQLQVPELPGSGGIGIDADGNAVLPQAAHEMANASRKAGFTPAVTAGILANVQHESGFNPGSSGDGGSAKGFFQHRLDRVDNFKRVTGVSPENATPAQAVKFFKHELDNPEEAGMTAEQANEIRNASSPQEAAMLIQKYYEKPKKVDAARGQTASLIYRTLHG
jgi:hypothetical protein